MSEEQKVKNPFLPANAEERGALKEWFRLRFAAILVLVAIWFFASWLPNAGVDVWGWIEGAFFVLLWVIGVCLSLVATFFFIKWLPPLTWQIALGVILGGIVLKLIGVIR